MLLLFIVSASLTCAFAPAETPDDFLGGLSHLSAHMDPAPAPAAPVVATPPRTAPAAATMVAALPPGFNRALAIEGGTITKGFSSADEARLARTLERTGLKERLLKIAIFRTGSVKMGMVKVQAGLASSGVLELAAVEEDAVNVLKAAFDPDLGLAHVDFIAVIPGLHNSDNDFHLPVFTLASDRPTWERAALATSDTGIIAALGVTRYAPSLIRYASDSTVHSAFSASAFTDPLMSDRWTDLLGQAKTQLPRAMAQPHDGVRVIRNGYRTQPRVALTIDDGPHPLITPLILEALKQAGVKATFFIVGKKAEEYPELLRRIVAEGHEIGNHTYSHARLTKLPPAQIWAEIRACDEVVRRLTGVKMRYLRPPGGGYDEQALRVVQAAGYSLALWTDNTGDWRKPPVQTIVHNALRKIAPGGIILMHQGDPVSVEAIPMIVRGLRLQHLEAGTISSIVGENGHESVENALTNTIEEDDSMPPQN